MPPMRPAAYRLPLFPLPVVLFPGAMLPLHVFEPRYRQMVAFCLEHDMRFGLLFHDPERHGPFHVEPGRIGCVAEIREFQPIPDGRSLLLTHGMERFRIEDGIESPALYPEALASAYRDRVEPPLDLPARRKRSIALFGRALERLTGEPVPPLFLPSGEDASFVLAQRIEVEPGWRQELLEIRSEAHRLERIDALLEPLTR